MTIREIDTFKKKLSDLFEYAGNFREDFNLTAHWSRYLCVNVSNFFDFSVRRGLVNFSSKKAHPFLIKYTSTRLRPQNNLNGEKLCQVTRSFNADWADELFAFIDGERKDAIDSIVANRNNIVHGDEKMAVGISLVRVKNYFEKICEVVDFLENLCIH